MYRKENLINKYIELANVEYKKKNFAGAIEYYEKHIEKNPDDAKAHNTIGFFYKKIDAYKHLDEQIKHFSKAFELKPDFDSAIRNLAFAYSRAGDYQKSAEYFETLLKLNPIADDYAAYAGLKIRLGDFDEGWKYYEYRFSKCFDKIPFPEFDKPRWEGQEIKDKTLLVQHEQGLGDSIQFFRYLQEAKPLVKKVIFRVRKQLFELFEANNNGIEIVEETFSIDNIKFDYYIPLISLPYVLKAQKETIPLSQGYIQADKTKVQGYKEKFFNNDFYKIGICWEGSLLGTQNRNIPLKYFYPICKLKNVKIYSFQKDGDLSALQNLSPETEITDLGKTFNDFSDTAAAMENIDLFITCDNSILNLAGAMSKKTFVLLPQHSEWRWFLDNATTPWYDSVKIFKKEQETETWSFQMEKIFKIIKKDFDKT